MARLLLRAALVLHVHLVTAVFAASSLVSLLNEAHSCLSLAPLSLHCQLPVYCHSPLAASSTFTGTVACGGTLKVILHDGTYCADNYGSSSTGACQGGSYNRQNCIYDLTAPACGACADVVPTPSPTTARPVTPAPTTAAPTNSPTNSPTTASPTQSPTNAPTTANPTPAPTCELRNEQT
jgi:hypothetical protein